MEAQNIPSGPCALLPFPLPGAPMNATQTHIQPGRLDARLLLSYGQNSRSIPRSIQVLVVGARTSAELIAQAELQRDVLFHAVDSHASVISEARGKARERGIENMEFEVLDLHSAWSESIDVPFGGFDVIQIAALPQGLENLTALLTRVKSVMSAHSVVTLDLPAAKQHNQMVAQAIAANMDRNQPMAERLEVARAFVDRMVSEEPNSTDWRRASLLSDIDFVDRYMQTEMRAVDVNELFCALDAAGMSFLRWHDSAAWNFETLELNRPEQERVRSLPMPEQFRVVEASRRPEMLSLVIGGANNRPRERFDLTKAGETHFMVHPGLVFSVETRNMWGVTEYDRLTVRRAGEDAVEVRPSPAQTALFALRDQREPFSGLNLVEVMTAEGASLEEALLALHQLVGMELLYRPHDHDVAEYFSAMTKSQVLPETSDVVVTPSLPQKNSFVPAQGEPAAPLPAKSESPSAPNLSQKANSRKNS
jgi:hypothetical protein